MPVAIKSLADGQLASSIGTIYQTPTNKQAIVESITLVNTNTSAETVNVYFLASGGTARRIIPKNTSLAASAMMECLDKRKTLEAGGKIQADTTTALKVDFVCSGVENS